MPVIRIFALITFLLISVPAFAQDAPIGAIMEVEGTARITHAGKTSPASIDMPVYLNDTLETGANSKANILFIDDTELTLSDNAAATIDEYIFDEGSTVGNKGRYSLLRGAFLFTSGLMTKNQKPDVTLETVYGSIGLRGTTVWGGQADETYGVLVQEGEVIVTNKRGQVRVPAGMGTNLRGRDAAPTAAAAWKPARIEQAVAMVTLKRHEMVMQKIIARKIQNKAIRAKLRGLRQQRQNQPDTAPTQKQGQMQKKPKQRQDQKKNLQERGENLHPQKQPSSDLPSLR